MLRAKSVSEEDAAICSLVVRKIDHFWQQVGSFLGRKCRGGEKKRQVSEGITIGRMGQPEEVAGCAVFLASEDSDYVVAQTYGVDGGNWMA
jgi:NAD(P)-dependent dehydrogenase (short-subunit alcohol dehydrogenase family)